MEEEARSINVMDVNKHLIDKIPMKCHHTCILYIQCCLSSKCTCIISERWLSGGYS